VIALKTPLDWIRLILALLLALPVLLVPFDAKGQWLFAIVAMVGAYAFKRWRDERGRFALALLALLISSRYVLWRTTHTLNFVNPTSALLGVGLYLAEIYAWIVLVLGIVQNGRPLDRPVVEIRGAPESWPTVDLLIPTYNESLDIVRTTVLAAMDLDYPADRFRVTILDDGKREEFRAFAEEVGCGYLVRDDNLHAKAGNLNAAIPRTDGELVAILDCDHVPTRAFLQLTVGWFQRDPRLALVQTPHHMYSPDPIQRNVARVERMSGEGDMFYGPVQMGNDLWNATFFCGSCAIIRREALAEVGGFRGETVTEDAHTALTLQRAGWNTAYLNARLSAGLATERLVLHIGQRVRWARGMTQILLLDCPLFGRGLTWQQRFCYMAALLHYQFPLPRIVFLTSPLAFLFFDQTVIVATPATIFAYAAPHLFCATMLASRVQGRSRRPFWNEIYETILAFHLLSPSVLTWFRPRKGKFNVTDKGSLLDQTFFDWRLMRPQVVCIALVVVGIALGVRRFWMTGGEQDSLLLNLGWATFNLVILLAAVAAARESRQVRHNIRFEQKTPASAWLATGHCIAAHTTDLSLGGALLELPGETEEAVRSLTHVLFDVGDATVVLPVEVMRAWPGRATVRFDKPDLLSQRYLVRLVMGRADAWQEASQVRAVGVVRSAWDILRIDLSSLRALFATPLARSRHVLFGLGAGLAMLLLVALPFAAQAQAQAQTLRARAEAIPGWLADILHLAAVAMPLGGTALLAAALLAGPMRNRFEMQARDRLACRNACDRDRSDACKDVMR